MNERLRKLLLYQRYITFCIERELSLDSEWEAGATSALQLLEMQAKRSLEVPYDEEKHGI